MGEKGKKGGKGGRPRIEIDWAIFDQLCAILCTEQEIANWLRCSVDTLERRVREEKHVGFAEYYEKQSAGGKISLRRKQFQIAMAGNVTMLIWLGKNGLHQADKVEQSGPDGGPIKINTAQELSDEELAVIIAQRTVANARRSGSGAANPA